MQTDVRILPDFPVYRLRLRYQAGQFGVLPRDCGAILRGTLGRAMHDVYCVKRDEDCSECACRRQCPYARFFSPSNRAQNPYYEQYDKYPRSYIVEPPLHHSRLEPGDGFEFNLLLMGDSADDIRAWVSAARRAGELGFGRERTGMELREITDANLFGEPGKPIILIRNHQAIIQPPDPIRFNDLLDVFLPNEPLSFLKVTFLTPARFLQDHQPVRSLRFYLLVQSILRRLSMLSELFEPDAPWRPDFHLYGKLADRVITYHDGTEWRERHRWSGRQKREHDIGGLTGQIIYAGPEIHLFLPIFYFACIVHVGKGTVFGNGRMEIEFV